MVGRRTADHRFGHRRTYRFTRRQTGLIWLYGSTGVRDSWFNIDEAFYPDGEGTAITRAGYPVGSMDMATKWANASGLADLDALYAAAIAYSFKRPKVHLFGASMGGATVLEWARRNPRKVKSIQLLIPAVDAQDIYDNNRAGFAAEVSAAHGGRPPDDRTPAAHPEEFRRFPVRIYGSSTDTVTPWALLQEFAAAIGGTDELVNMGDQGHFWSYDDGYDGDAIVDFMDQHN